MSTRHASRVVTPELWAELEHTSERQLVIQCTTKGGDHRPLLMMPNLFESQVVFFRVKKFGFTMI